MLEVACECGTFVVVEKWLFVCGEFQKVLDDIMLFEILETPQ